MSHNDEVALRAIAREWGRIGCLGFGGPPTHIRMLRQLCVEDREWLTPQEFEDAVAAVNLMPGPASTQLAIYLAWKQRGRVGAVVGGLCFIVPGLICILVLAQLFLASSAPPWIVGAGLGAGAAVPAIALAAGWSLVPASRSQSASQTRWLAYVLIGIVAVQVLAAWIVLAPVLCGLVEMLFRQRINHAPVLSVLLTPKVVLPTLTLTSSIAWVAFKVGALSYGGGFVIVPLMQFDAVTKYGWMSASQFLTAVALGQVTPGPVVQTVAVVGFAAAGLAGALLAAVVAFLPSFVFVLIGASRFESWRENSRVRAFIGGAGPVAIGAILGSAFMLAQGLTQVWQFALLAICAGAVVVLRRGTVGILLLSGAVGMLAHGLSHSL